MISIYLKNKGTSEVRARNSEPAMSNKERPRRDFFPPIIKARKSPNAWEATQRGTRVECELISRMLSKTQGGKESNGEGVQL